MLSRVWPWQSGSVLQCVLGRSPEKAPSERGRGQAGLLVRGSLVSKAKKFWMSRRVFDQMSGGFFGH
jgi:hypothetical protein